LAEGRIWEKGGEREERGQREKIDNCPKNEK
jgi:hypothetical protein